MREHTPGPWTNDKHSAFVWSKDGNICVCGAPRASTVVGYTEADIGSADLEEAVANARLTAAAPDLLIALRALVERIDLNGGLGEYKGGPAFALGNARKAIAKAVGG